VVARYRESDTSPKEDFVLHQAGLDGNGASSYIDLVVCRNKDANTAWTSASDGTLEERLYYCQNWRADVSAIVTSSGTMKEWVKYSAYGIPFGLPGGDSNSSGATDTADLNQVQTWINGSTYDVRGDIDLDGDVDSTDKSTIRNNFSGISLGRGVLTASATGNRRGLTGYESSGSVAFGADVRHRALHYALGRWFQRDQAKRTRSQNEYDYASSDPINEGDPQGTTPEPSAGSQTGGQKGGHTHAWCPGCEMDGYSFTNGSDSTTVTQGGHTCTISVSLTGNGGGTPGKCIVPDDNPRGCTMSQGCSVNVNIQLSSTCAQTRVKYEDTYGTIPLGSAGWPNHFGGTVSFGTAFPASCGSWDVWTVTVSAPDSRSGSASASGNVTVSCAECGP
jgi:RHS repeat-associated protein